MSGNSWTNFVKDWAKENDTTYMCAITKPELKAAYKAHKITKKRDVKQNSFQEIKDAVVALAEEITPPVEKKKPGRPSKYATDEERKKAKKEKTLASTRKMRAERAERVKTGKTDEYDDERIEREADQVVQRRHKMLLKKQADLNAQLKEEYDIKHKIYLETLKEFKKTYNPKNDRPLPEWSKHGRWELNDMRKVNDIYKSRGLIEHIPQKFCSDLVGCEVYVNPHDHNERSKSVDELQEWIEKKRGKLDKDNFVIGDDGKPTSRKYSGSIW